MELYRNNEIPPIEYTPGTSEFRDAVIGLARYWTAIAEDLHADEPGVQERTAAACLRFRKECAMFDYARALQWHDPQGVYVHTDIPYLPDGGYRDGEVRGHLLDVYIPRDAIVRGGNTLPVYIDIHGGRRCTRGAATACPRGPRRCRRCSSPCRRRQCRAGIRTHTARARRISAVRLSASGHGTGRCRAATSPIQLFCFCPCEHLPLPYRRNG